MSWLAQIKNDLSADTPVYRLQIAGKAFDDAAVDALLFRQRVPFQAAAGTLRKTGNERLSPAIIRRPLCRACRESHDRDG
jgi:hypothetical protein